MIMSSEKAREILRHGHVRGMPLSDAQRRLFGAIASGYKVRRNPLLAIVGMGNPGHEPSLHERIANELGWSVQDTRSFSMPMLRDIVRKKSPKLAHEIDVLIGSGGHILGGPFKKGYRIGGNPGHEPMRPIPIEWSPTCDACGTTGIHKDEVLCERCKLRMFGQRKPNPHRETSLEMASMVPGFKKAYSRFIKLHGTPPTGAKLVKVDDGKSTITKKVVFTVGDIPEFVYQGTVGGKRVKGSNKAGKLWVHKTAKRNMPMLAVDPETEQLFALGGETKVTDWLREKSERRRKH